MHLNGGAKRAIPTLRLNPNLSKSPFSPRSFAVGLLIGCMMTVTAAEPSIKVAGQILLYGASRGVQIDTVGTAIEYGQNSELVCAAMKRHDNSYKTDMSDVEGGLQLVLNLGISEFAQAYFERRDIHCDLRWL